MNPVDFPKLDVAGSIPVSRSMFSTSWERLIIISGLPGIPRMPLLFALGWFRPLPGIPASLAIFPSLVKAGQLSSAFGLAPVEYDDSKMALPTPPLLYLSNMQLPTGEISSRTRDLLYEDDYGRVPVMLYGVPGTETEISLGRVDGRLQITNSSPANPQRLLSRSQSVQWTVGAGYTVPEVSMSVGRHFGGLTWTLMFRKIYRRKSVFGTSKLPALGSMLNGFVAPSLLKASGSGSASESPSSSSHPRPMEPTRR